MFFFSVLYCLCMALNRKSIWIQATVALLTQILTQKAAQESDSWMQEEGVKDWVSTTPQGCQLHGLP